MATIYVGRPRHLTSDEVMEQVGERWGREEIEDACAVTIASWYQSPRGHGLVFAALASTGSVDHSALLDAIASERPQAPTEDDRQQLDMLATWALSHIR